jgi:hypothetical protein
VGFPWRRASANSVTQQSGLVSVLARYSSAGDVETDLPQFATVKEGLIGRHLTFVPLGAVPIPSV